jgi:2-succinyl-6-hydroxy-2,4-cyclohexadiene-1-carboxylate synthase
MKIWCLHGAMQNSSVWDFFEDKFCAMGLPFSVQKVDLYHNISTSLEQWARSFCSSVTEESAEEKSFLLGYSLGGRLAMHAYVNSPQLWSGVIIVSADPGAHSNKSRENILAKDLAWSKRFQSEDLESLLKEWDHAPVFCQRSNTAPRELTNLDSLKISKLLSVYSKGRQQNLIPCLQQEGAAPMLYLSGEEDYKYSMIGEGLSLSCTSVTHQTIPDAGHRVPWENPSGFLSVVNQFLGENSTFL